MTDHDDIPLSPPNPNKGESKTSRIPIKVVQLDKPLPKPNWIRGRAPSGPEVARLKKLLRDHQLYTVCEEAACPNLGECFRHGTATFMIMGKNCTRRCPFCDVGHARPDPLDENEPKQLASAIQDMALQFVVITSVDRDDLRDGGAQHFVDCISAIRKQSPDTSIEILIPDFRGRLDKALNIFEQGLPDVLNHNLETVSRLYKQARPGADYQHSLSLVKQFGERFPDVPTKSGLMVGLGETNEEIEVVMQDLRDNDCNMLTIGQYLQPGPHHLPVLRYVTPDEFRQFEKVGLAMGFDNVASGPMVRSSYHAELQVRGSGS